MWFGTATVPVTSVPMKLPSTRLPLVPASVMRMPRLALPEMTFNVPAVVPPIVLPVAPPMIWTPSWPLGTALVPVTSVPM